MSLDKRLKEITQTLVIANLERSHPKYGSTEDALEAIKQAFIDEGWSTPVNKEDLINFGTEENPVMIHKDSLPFSDSDGGSIDIPKDLRMTGPEWLARFEKEFEKTFREDDDPDLKYNFKDITYLDDFGVVDILNIARRAAGVDE
jgi:hypothetical protein